MPQQLDFSKISNIKFDDVHLDDFPDFSDAKIISADYDGVLMDDEQLDQLNEDGAFVHDAVLNYLF